MFRCRDAFFIATPASIFSLRRYAWLLPPYAMLVLLLFHCFDIHNIIYFHFLLIICLMPPDTFFTHFHSFYFIDYISLFIFCRCHFIFFLPPFADTPFCRLLLPPFSPFRLLSMLNITPYAAIDATAPPPRCHEALLIPTMNETTCLCQRAIALISAAASFSNAASLSLMPIFAAALVVSITFRLLIGFTTLDIFHDISRLLSTRLPPPPFRRRCHY